MVAFRVCLISFSAADGAALTKHKTGITLQLTLAIAW